MAAGRPRIYDNVEQLEVAIENYFNETSKPAVTGLALYLGFADKTTLYEYRDREGFSYPIKRALTRIELYHEEGLTENNVTGRIFALKNMGWKDKTEHEVNGNMQLNWHEEKIYEVKQEADKST